VSGKQRSRGALYYQKPPLTLDELVGLLSDRGLHIPDPDRARRYLRHIGYYRLSPYTIPFQQGRPDHLFRADTSFDDVLDLYTFDRALRLLVMDALERVEVAIRAALTDHMSTRYNDPHWYTNPDHFEQHDKYANFQQTVQQTCDRQLGRSPDVVDGSLVHRSALEHYLTAYGSPVLPPSWLMVETLTLGQLEGVIRNLRRKGDQSAIAASVGLPAPVLKSWMRTYVRVRNICAHHGRLWNVGLGVYPLIPTSTTVSWLHASESLPERSRQRLYPVLVSLQSVLDSVSPRSSWARRLHELMSGRPQMNLAGMGMPQGWDDDLFWSRHLA